MLVAKWELTGINGYVCNIIRILHWTRHGGGKKKRQEPNDDGEASYVSSWCDSSVPFVVVAGRWPGLAGHKGKKRKRTPTQSTTAAFSLFSWSCCFYERQRRFFFPFQRWPLSHFFFLPLHPLTRLSIPQRLLYVSTFETGISNSIAFLSLAAMIVIIGLCVRLYLRQVILTINWLKQTISEMCLTELENYLQVVFDNI